MKRVLFFFKKLYVFLRYGIWISCPTKEDLEWASKEIKRIVEEKK